MRRLAFVAAATRIPSTTALRIARPLRRTQRIATRSARLAPREPSPTVAFANPITSWSSDGTPNPESPPRLVALATSLVALAFRFLLGCKPGDVTARVEARSNLDVLRGRLSLLSVDFRKSGGFWCRFREGSIVGRDLDLGLGPFACLAAPFLFLLFRPNLLATALGLYVFSRARALRRLLGGRPCKVEFAASLTSDDLEKSRLFRPLLRAIVETLVTSSPLTQFPGPITDPSTRFLLNKASFEGDKLILDAVAAFGGAAPADGQPAIPQSRQSFVLRANVAPSRRAGDSLEFLDPEIHASFDDWTKPLGLKLPDVWIPLVSGVGVPLGASNRVHEARIANGGCSLRGSVNLNGYENAGDTATLVRRPP